MCLNCRDRQQATQFVPQTTGGQRREFQKFGGEGCQTQRGCIQSRIQERIFWVQPCTGSFYTPTGYRGPTGGVTRQDDHQHSSEPPTQISLWEGLTGGQLDPGQSSQEKQPMKRDSGQQDSQEQGGSAPPGQSEKHNKMAI